MRRVWQAPRRSGLGFVVAFVAFFLVGAAWAVAMPVNGTYDEKGHLVRAYAVASGQWFPDGRVYVPELDLEVPAFDAPASLLPGAVDCTWRPPPPKPASCQGPAGDRAIVEIPSTAARYSPVYYAPVGLPLLIWPDHTGIVLGRGVSVLLSALLLAAAAAIAGRLRNRLLLAGVVLVATPMTMNLAGALNPNGLEIAAGVLLFTALLALLRGHPAVDAGADGGAVPAAGGEEAPARGLLWLAGVAAVLLVTLRQLGPLLFVVDVAACLAVAAPGRFGSLWRRRDARWILGGAAAGGLAIYGSWLAVSGLATVDPLPGNARHLEAGELWGQIATVRVPFYLQQIVGQFGYGETMISRYAVCAWYLVWAAVVLPALIMGGWRVRLALTGLVGFCGALLVGLEAREAAVVGWSMHGRYVLPSAVGVVLIAAAVVGTAGRPAGPADGPRWAWLPGGPRRAWLPLALVAAVAPLHGYALARVMTRYQLGIDAALDPLHGVWLPPGGPFVPLLLLAGGLVVQVALLMPVGAGGARPGGGDATRHRWRAHTTVGRSSPSDAYPMAH